MSRVQIEAKPGGLYEISDPNRAARRWAVSVDQRGNDAYGVTDDDGGSSIFSQAENDADTLYKVVRVELEGEMTSTRLSSDLPDRFTIVEDSGAEIDSYASRYPGSAPDSMADILTWYVPKKRLELLALIHVMENLWTTATQSRTPVKTIPANTSDEIVIEAVPFSQRGKTFLQFAGPVSQLLHFIEVIPNTEEHPDYPQRHVDNKRLRRIGDYVMRSESGYLLPSIIINFYDTVSIEKVGRKVRIRIPNDGRKHAYCLDGQHRLFTFDIQENPMIGEFTDTDYELPVTAMVNEPKTVWHDQFVVINTEQKPVNKNQILSMEEHFHSERLTDELAVAIRISEELNRRPSCVLHRRIFIRSGDKGTIVKLKNFSKLIEGHFDPKGTFRRAYGPPQSEEVLALLIEGYVNAVHDLFPEEWDSSKHVLTKTAGWESLFSVDGVLPVAYRRANRAINSTRARDEWLKVLEPLRTLEIKLNEEFVSLDWESYKFSAYCSGRVNIDKFVRAVRSAYEDA